MRYNPDAFTLDGATRRTTKDQRETALASVLDELMRAAPTRALTVQYMFYDCTGDRLDIWDSGEYNREIEQCCNPPIM